MAVFNVQPASPSGWKSCCCPPVVGVSPVVGGPGCECPIVQADLSGFPDELGFGVGKTSQTLNVVIPVTETDPDPDNGLPICCVCPQSAIFDRISPPTAVLINSFGPIPPLSATSWFITVGNSDLWIRSADEPICNEFPNFQAQVTFNMTGPGPSCGPILATLRFEGRYRCGNCNNTTQTFLNTKQIALHYYELQFSNFIASPNPICENQSGTWCVTIYNNSTKTIENLVLTPVASGNIVSVTPNTPVNIGPCQSATVCGTFVAGAPGTGTIQLVSWTGNFTGMPTESDNLPGPPTVSITINNCSVVGVSPVGVSPVGVGVSPVSDGIVGILEN